MYFQIRYFYISILMLILFSLSFFFPVPYFWLLVLLVFSPSCLISGFWPVCIFPDITPWCGWSIRWPNSAVIFVIFSLRISFRYLLIGLSLNCCLFYIAYKNSAAERNRKGSSYCLRYNLVTYIKSGFGKNNLSTQNSFK